MSRIGIARRSITIIFASSVYSSVKNIEFYGKLRLAAGKARPIFVIIGITELFTLFFGGREMS